MNVNYFASNTYTNSYMQSLMAAIATALTANALVQEILYNNVVVPSRALTLAALTETTFGGYGRKTITTWSPPAIDQTSGEGEIFAPSQQYFCDGTSSDTVQGAALVEANGGTQATATNAGAAGSYNAVFVITAGGTLYEVPPLVHLTGATGSGANAHAVLTAGVVTSIVLDDPGSAYTTYTVVVDPPQSLIKVSPFPAPVNMANNTDTIVTVEKVSVPAIVTGP